MIEVHMTKQPLQEMAKIVIGTKKKSVNIYIYTAQQALSKI